MRKIKEILRLRWEVGLGYREIGRSLNLSHHTVSNYVARAEAVGLTWPLPGDLDDISLEELLFPDPSASKQTFYAEPDFAKIHQELRRKGVTLQLLWTEYKQDHPDGYQYSRFCELYQQWRGKLDVSMRQTHQAGDKMFVDYAGLTVPITDPNTGEIRPAYIFVAILGASNYTYAEASLSLNLMAWINAHCRAFQFFGGVPRLVVPDNPKTGVSSPSYYEPELNATYQDMAAHYGTAILPARPRKPKDKAKVEKAVQDVERWLLAPLRHQTFFSAVELNQVLKDGIIAMNNRPFQKLEGSRKSMYETLDKPALQPLPSSPYEFAVWKKARVNIDYHIEVDHNYYSVPYSLVHKQVDVRITANTIEVLHKGQRVSSHPRSLGKGRFATDVAHRPPSHQKYLEWTPERIITWAENIGPYTANLVMNIFESKPHPEQAYRACLGILRLSKRYSNDRLEAAAKRAIQIGTCSYRSINSILDKGLDQVPLEEAPVYRPINHSNVRGPKYYSEEDPQ